MVKSLWTALKAELRDLVSPPIASTRSTPVKTAVQDPTTQQQVQQAIAEFEKSQVAGVWASVDKPTLIADIKARVNDPFQVNQGGQPFCGPASIVFELVRTQPLKYVQICRSLFENGGFAAQTRQIEATPRLRQSHGRLQMSQADWMVMATLRDCENVLFPVTLDGSDILRNLAGITKPWEMTGWAREILGYGQVDHIITEIYGEFRGLQETSSIVAGGGVAFALITAEGLLENRRPFLPYPNHWITLLGNVSIQVQRPSQVSQGQVKCDVYSWGQQMHIDMQQGPVENYFWGLVLAR